MMEAIRRLKSGRRVIHTAHDPFPGVPDGIPVKVDVEIDAEGRKDRRGPRRQSRTASPVA